MFRPCRTRCCGSASSRSAIAFGVGVHLTLLGGWPLLAYALLGGAAAIFYVAPPIRWAYRGLGELVIALSYGPVDGARQPVSPHARVLGRRAARVARARLSHHGARVVNAIPDYHQDRLVGKRNLCVRLGRQRAVYLYLGLAAAGIAVVPSASRWVSFPCCRSPRCSPCRFS
jgi:1,4-dihydroxy-2-naphthoate octaprenyltransferase